MKKIIEDDADVLQRIYEEATKEECTDYIDWTFSRLVGQIIGLSEQLALMEEKHQQALAYQEATYTRQRNTNIDLAQEVLRQANRIKELESELIATEVRV